MRNFIHTQRADRPRRACGCALAERAPTSWAIPAPRGPSGHGPPGCSGPGGTPRSLGRTDGSATTARRRNGCWRLDGCGFPAAFRNARGRLQWHRDRFGVPGGVGEFELGRMPVLLVTSVGAALALPYVIGTLANRLLQVDVHHCSHLSLARRRYRRLPEREKSKLVSFRIRFALPCQSGKEASRRSSLISVTGVAELTLLPHRNGVVLQLARI